MNLKQSICFEKLNKLVQEQAVLLLFSLGVEKEDIWKMQQ